jgi:gamma-glutamyltranspeptidase/glutathione hydrolase
MSLCSIRSLVRPPGIRHPLVAIVLAIICATSASETASRAPVRSTRGMVGSTHAIASKVGADILDRGGNAVDAAVAVGFALAVVHPAAGNIGGGGLMLIRFADGRATAIDYREVAPKAATRDMFLDEQGRVVSERSLVGPLAAGVPGSVAGLVYVQKKYGTLPLSAVVEPAVGLAQDGVALTEAEARMLASLVRDTSQSAERAARFPETLRLFSNGGQAYAAGERLVQKDLAATLRRVATQGAEGFYRGAVADLIVAEMKRSGGLITHDDLASYRPIERAPLEATYRDVGIVAMPPISSGGVALIQLLNILEPFPIRALGHNSSKTIHLMAEAERRVYADRAKWLGDPAFFDVPVSGLTSKQYAETLRASIDPNRATPSPSVKPGNPEPYESDQTTHYSVVDAAGNAVATTTTLNGSFGNGQAVPGAGFLLNNEMDDFSAKPGAPNMFGLVGGVANEIAPAKRMLSSMTPTILTRDGKTFLVVGSPGGSRIITTVLQVVMNVVDHGLDVKEAVDAPRFHHQWLPDHIRIERVGFPSDVVKALEGMGHSLRVQADMGDVHAILIDPKTSVRLGTSDPRADGRTVAN